jgi:hypothetical protein
MKELMLIQSELKAPKNQFNRFGNYNYRSCEDILEAVKPLLAKNECSLTISDDIVEVGGRIYVKATAKIVNKDGNEVANSAFAREAEEKKGMDVSQITGSASSYARKYALNGLFCIDDTRDADATNTHGKEEKKMAEKVASKPIDELKIKVINGAVGEVLTEEQLKKTLAHYKVESIADLNEAQACEIIKRINELRGA